MKIGYVPRLGFLLLICGFAIFFIRERSKSEQPEKISGAYRALNLWSFQRAYPNAAMPEVGHFAAFEHNRQTLRKNASQTADGWQTMGPHNYGGRTLAVVFNPQNPNTIFAGSASGGLWRSTTGGIGADAWDYLPTGFPVLAVSSIAIAPSDSNIMYIGTGEVYNYQAAGTGAAYRSTRGTYGIGILKSTDGGQSWEKSLDWSSNQQRGVWAIKIDPNNEAVIWAATTEGVFKSIDAGANWTQVHSVILAMDLAIDPLNSDNVLVGCGNFGSTGHGIYRTTNGGINWTKITSGVPSAFAGKVQLDVYPSPFGTQFLASIGNGFSTTSGNASWLCKSSDNGQTWQIMSTQDYSQWQGWYSHDAAFNPSDFNEITAVGIEVYQSTNGGSTLQQKSSGNAFGGVIPPGSPEGAPTYVHADIHDIKYHPTNPEIIYFATDGGVFRSIDGGSTFAGCNGGYQTTQFYNGFSSSPLDSNLAMGGLQDNGTTIYVGGTAWAKFVIGGDGSWSAMDPLDANVMYGSWQGLNVLKSTNGGANWFTLGIPGAGRITTFIAPFVIAQDNPDVIYAGRDIVYRSTNGGQSWTATNNGNPLDGNPALAMAVAPQNNNLVYAATAPFQTVPGVFRSLNGGAVWANVTGNLPNRFPTDIAIDPLDESIAYVTFSGFGASHVFKTEDYGTNWTPIDAGLPDVPHNAIEIDSNYPAHVYVANDLGVFFSPDGGASWEDFSEDLPDAVIAMSLAISLQNNKLRVATHGNGAYQRTLVSPAVGIAEPGILPDGFALAQNYPNPFNPETTISWTLSKNAVVSLEIFNALGQNIRTLLPEGSQSPGEYQLLWDGRDARGRQVASGIYLYRLSVDGAAKTRRMNLIR